MLSNDQGITIDPDVTDVRPLAVNRSVKVPLRLIERLLNDAAPEELVLTVRVPPRLALLGPLAIAAVT